jgi:ketosteroid isomerase-like protein
VSQENVEVVQRARKLFNAGQPLGALVADDFVLDVSNVEALVAVGIGPIYHGLAGWTAFIEDWLSVFDVWHDDWLSVDDIADQVVVVHRQSARAKSSGALVDMTTGTVYTLRDGLIAQLTFYRDPTEALKAVGLEE